ncbi:33144_t:CDS:2, partial [Gigaspora margarita]
MLWCTTADRQERDQKGEKAQENIKKKAIDVVTIKYLFIATMQERVLGMQERKIRYKFGSTPKQKRSQEVKKVQEDTRKKVSKWIAEHLRQIDGLQIWHFVPCPAIKKWQLRGKQLCEGISYQNSQNYSIMSAKINRRSTMPSDTIFFLYLAGNKKDSIQDGLQTGHKAPET